MKTIQLIIEAAILLSLIVVCVLLAGKRTVKVDGDVRLTHLQVSDIVDAIEEAGSSEATVKIDKVQMGQLVEAIELAAKFEEPKWEYRVGLIDLRDQIAENESRIETYCMNGWEFFETSRSLSDRFDTVYFRKRIK